MLRVCRTAFLNIIQEKRDLVNRFCQKFMESGTTPKETRGGDRKTAKYQPCREAIKEFIKTFRPIQSHYTRGKHMKRQYFPSQLNTRKLWTLYNEKNEAEGLTVKYEYFRTVFNECVNISFDNPYSDKCSTCCSFENKINLEKDKKKRDSLKFNLTHHKKHAEAFYEKLRLEVENALPLCYDCQKNLVLPKVPDQAAYYSRQLYLYALQSAKGHQGVLKTRIIHLATFGPKTNFQKVAIKLHPPYTTDCATRT